MPERAIAYATIAYRLAALHLKIAKRGEMQILSKSPAREEKQQENGAKGKPDKLNHRTQAHFHWISICRKSSRLRSINVRRCSTQRHKRTESAGCVVK